MWLLCQNSNSRLPFHYYCFDISPRNYLSVFIAQFEENSALIYEHCQGRRLVLFSLLLLLGVPYPHSLDFTHPVLTFTTLSLKILRFYLFKKLIIVPNSTSPNMHIVAQKHRLYGMAFWLLTGKKTFAIFTLLIFTTQT